MELKETTVERKFTLELTETEASVLRNIIGECSVDHPFPGNLYDALEALGVEEAGSRARSACG